MGVVLRCNHQGCKASVELLPTMKILPPAWSVEYPASPSKNPDSTKAKAYCPLHRSYRR